MRPYLYPNEIKYIYGILQIWAVLQFYWDIKFTLSSNVFRRCYYRRK